MSAWTLDPSAEGPQPVTGAAGLEIAQEGPESITLRAELVWGRSNFRLLTTIHADSPRIDCVLKVDWLEKGDSRDARPHAQGLLEPGQRAQGSDLRRALRRSGPPAGQGSARPEMGGRLRPLPSFNRASTAIRWKRTPCASASCAAPTTLIPFRIWAP